MQNSYRILLQLPLFQGMSMAELDMAIERLKMDFSKCSADMLIASDGQSVDGLKFLISGKAMAITSAHDGGYTLEEEIMSPCVLQPERLFGLTQRYTSNFKALTDCSLLSISKEDVIMLTTNSEVFRLNLLNILSTLIQRKQRLPWHQKPTSIRRKIALFVENRSLRPAGRKILNIGMVRLGHELGESRLNISDTLNEMAAEGLIQLYRSRIVIPALEKIV